MSRYIVLIKSEYDQPLNIAVNFYAIGQDIWKTLDKGVWRYESGACYLQNKTKHKRFFEINTDVVKPHKHLVLCNTPKTSYSTGVILYDFKGWTSVNDSGIGLVSNNYSLASVVNMTVRWELID